MWRVMKTCYSNENANIIIKFKRTIKQVTNRNNKVTGLASILKSSTCYIFPRWCWEETQKELQLGKKKCVSNKWTLEKSGQWRIRLLDISPNYLYSDMRWRNISLNRSQNLLIEMYKFFCNWKLCKSSISSHNSPK